MSDTISAAIIMPLTLILTCLFLYAQLVSYASVKETAVQEVELLVAISSSDLLFATIRLGNTSGTAANAELAHLSTDLVADLLRLHQADVI